MLQKHAATAYSMLVHGLCSGGMATKKRRIVWRHLEIEQRKANPLSTVLHSPCLVVVCHGSPDVILLASGLLAGEVTADHEASDLTT